MHASTFRRLPVLAVLALGPAGFVGACATATPASTATPVSSTTPASDEAVASASPQQRWTPDHLIQQNQLLPNGLRPFRYFYW